MDNKLKEVNDILNTQTNIFIKNIIDELYNNFNDLKNFTYIENEEQILTLKNCIIRYVTFGKKLYYGGFFLKFEKINNDMFIYLINKERKVWKINFNNYYVFFANKHNKNDNKRQLFESIINNYNSTLKIK
jgi:hypothetical protein